MERQLELLTVPEVAKILRVTEARAYELCRSRTIPVVKVGRQVRVSSAALQQFIISGGVSLAGGWRRK